MRIEVVDSLEVCSYCMNPWQEFMRYRGCCGEAHAVNAHVVKINGIEVEYLFSDDELAELKLKAEEIHENK